MKIGLTIVILIVFTTTTPHWKKTLNGKKLLSVEYSNPIDTSKSLSIACKDFKFR